MGSALFPCSTLFLRLRTSSFLFFFFTLIVVVMPCLFVFIMHHGLHWRKGIEENHLWMLWTVTEIPLGPLSRAASAAGCTQTQAHRGLNRCHLHTEHWSRAVNAPGVTLRNWYRVKQRRVCRTKRRQMHMNGHFWSCCAWGPAPTQGLPEADGHHPSLAANPAGSLLLFGCALHMDGWASQEWGLHVWPLHDSACLHLGTSW